MTAPKKNVTLIRETHRALKVKAVQKDQTLTGLLVGMLESYAAGEPIPKRVMTADYTAQVKVPVAPETWDAVLQRAEVEGLTIHEVVEAEARRVLAE